MSIAFSPDPPRPRARRLTLAIGLPLVLALIIWGAFGVVSLAGQDSYRIPPTALPGSGRLTASVGSGDVAISPSNDGRSSYHGVVHYSLFRPNLHWRTSTDQAVLSGQPICIGWGNCGVNLRLAVPANRPVNTKAGSGDIRVRDLTAAVEARTGSGDILASRLSGQLQAFNTSGQITGTQLTSKRVLARETSGDVTLAFSKPPTQVRATDSSGNITVAVPGNVAYYIVAKAGSGATSIRVPQNPSARRKIYLRDGSGNITVVPYHA